MEPASLSELRRWLTEAGLAGKGETALLDGFCRRALDAGLPIARAAIIIDTLHPVHEGRAFLWRREGGQTQTELVEYGPTSEGEAAENWRRSVFFHLLETGGSLFRVRFHAGETATIHVSPPAVTSGSQSRADAGERIILLKGLVQRANATGGEFALPNAIASEQVRN
jgi:hypothetical protein